MGSFWKKILYVMSIILLIRCLNIERQTDTQKNDSVSILDAKNIRKLGQLNDRILTTASQPFKINYVIQSFLKNYSDRTSFCHYLCYSNSLLSFFETQSCYLSYNCPSLILQNILIVSAIIFYGILPILMILLGVWNFKCLSHNIALITGVIFINQIYSKFSQQFHDDMQTDYDISTSQGTQENNTQSQQG